MPGGGPREGRPVARSDELGTASGELEAGEEAEGVPESTSEGATELPDEVGAAAEDGPPELVETSGGVAG
jgi:hypothetical protein